MKTKLSIWLLFIGSLTSVGCVSDEEVNTISQTPEDEIIQDTLDIRSEVTFADTQINLDNIDRIDKMIGICTVVICGITLFILILIIYNNSATLKPLSY